MWRAAGESDWTGALAPRPSSSPRRAREWQAWPREGREREAGRWPIEIAFLAPTLGPGVLARATETARAQGVSADRALLAEGLVSETKFYRALARAGGARFVDEAFRPAAGENYAAAIRLGAVAVETRLGRRYLVAPQGETLKSFLRLPGGVVAESMLVTTPTRLADCVRAVARARELAWASDRLAMRDPLASARTPLSPRFVLAAQAALVALIFVAASAPDTVWLALSLAFTLVFLAAVALRGAAAVASCAPAPRGWAQRDRDLPIYTVVVALHREAEVAGKLVAALDAIDYPRAKLDVILALEEGDEATIAAFRALDLPARYRIVVAPDGQPRTKPRALNVALPLARGALLTIYDAEDEPEPGQLRAAAARFAVAPRQVACLQGRLAIDNIEDGWLARLFALEYAALFDVLNPGLAKLGLPIALGGTSNHFRTDVLRRVGGWDAWNVTEDADLGLRLARFGYRVEALDSATHEEAPARLSAWLGQRRRWLKGWMQTLAVHFRSPRRLAAEMGPGRALAAFALMWGVVLGPLAGPAFLLAAIGDLATGRLQTHGALALLWAGLFVGGVVTTLATLILGMKRRGLPGLWPWLALLPVYYALVSFVAWQALFEWLDNPFHWEKTRHGLARSSRRAARRPS
jgi:cellulose synthase/poly-beta-1,6-N-acetylglucosamine synthase-like glycosyltransferase